MWGMMASFWSFVIIFLIGYFYHPGLAMWLMVLDIVITVLVVTFWFFWTLLIWYTRHPIFLDAWMWLTTWFNANNIHGLIYLEVTDKQAYTKVKTEFENWDVGPDVRTEEFKNTGPPTVPEALVAIDFTLKRRVCLYILGKLFIKLEDPQPLNGKGEERLNYNWVKQVFVKHLRPSVGLLTQLSNFDICGTNEDRALGEDRVCAKLRTIRCVNINCARAAYDNTYRDTASIAGALWRARQLDRDCVPNF
jgi:hypothetical protein